MKISFYFIGINVKIFISNSVKTKRAKETFPTIDFVRPGTESDWSYGEKRIIRYIYLLGIP
jgi:hypothetical protein